MRPTMKSLVAPAALLILLACQDRPQEHTDASVDAAVQDVRSSLATFEREVRSAIDEAGAQLAELDERYALASAQTAEDWTRTRATIRDYRTRLEEDLSQLETGTEDSADSLMTNIVQDLESLTQRIERARLEAIDGGEAFVAVSRERLGELDREIERIVNQVEETSGGVRAEVSDGVSELRSDFQELDERVEVLSEATAEEIAEKRHEIAERIASLSAAVRLELLRLEGEWST